MEFSKRIEDILEENQINYTIEKQNGRNGEEYYADLEFYSDAGEDFCFSVFFDPEDESSFVKAFCEYAEEFDPDEHVELRINSRGKNGVPDSTSAIVEDANSIDTFLNEVAEELATGKVRSRRDLFEESYIKWTTYQNSEEKNREPAYQAWLESAQKLNEMPSGHGSAVWSEYVNSRNNGNTLLNFGNDYTSKPADTIGRDVEIMRECGVKCFTYSAESTDVIENLSYFQNAGCKIGEIVQVFTGRDIHGDLERGPAVKVYIQ